MKTQDPQVTAQFHAEDSPFEETVVIRLFYPDHNRQEILHEMLRAISRGVSIVTLTGDEGSGKTMMCRMVEQRAPGNFVTVFFPQTVESFEDVVRVIARRLEVEPSMASGDIPRLLQAITAILRKRETRLLIIFDEAERIYLATLERVRKMLDQINASGPLLQIVLSGRSGLHNNFKNLALCNFQEVEEKHLTLEPLSEQETFDYLNHAIRHDGAVEDQHAFTTESAGKIFAESRGNFRSIKALAKDSMHGQAPDTSFFVLLDTVKDGEEKARPRRRTKSSTPKTFNLEKRKMLIGGGVVCAVILAFLFLRSGHNPDTVSTEPSPETKNTTVISQSDPTEHLPEKSAELPAEVTPAKITESEPERDVTSPSKKMTQPILPEKEHVAAMVEPVQPDEQPAVTGEPAQIVEPRTEKKAAAVEQVQPAEPVAEKSAALPETGEPADPQEEKIAAPLETVQSVQSGEENPPPSGEMARPEQVEKEEIIAREAAAQSAEAAKKEPVPAVVITARKIVKYHDRLDADAITQSPQEPGQRNIEPKENEIEEIKLIKPAKVRSERAREQTMEAATDAPVVLKAEEQKVVKAAPVAGKSNGGGGRLYSRRVAAGTSWLLGLKDDRYTVQLMVVTDGQAEKKLKELLAEESFQGKADKVYILKKESDPDVQYIFYGEYKTMLEARNARNTIPGFLRGLKPYAMSVKGAVRKVQEE